MQRLTAAPNLAIAQIWIDLLAQAGIAARLQRQYLQGIAGDLAPDQCLPEVWVDDARLAERARRLLADWQRRPERRWHCHACGEWVEGGFDSCWNCGAWMPGLGPADGSTAR